MMKRLSSSLLYKVVPRQSSMKLLSGFGPLYCDKSVFNVAYKKVVVVRSHFCSHRNTTILLVIFVRECNTVECQDGFGWMEVVFTRY